MRHSDRYLGKQVFFGTILAVVLLCVVFIMGTLYQEIRELMVRYQAPPKLVGQFLLLSMPYPLIFALPWGFLVTVLLTVGRLSRQNELVGFRSAGVSLVRLALPIFVLGAFFSGVCWHLSGSISPAAKLRAKELITDSLKSDPVSLLASNSETRLPGFQAFVTAKEGTTLEGFHLYQLSSDERGAEAETYIFAEKVDLSVDSANEQFVLSFQNAFIEQLNPDGPGTVSQPITASTAEPWPVAYPTAKLKDKPSYLSNRVLFSELGQKQDKKRRLKVIAELQQRHALSLACFSFAFIAIPLGITSQRRETRSGLIVSLLIAGLFFGMLLLAEDLDDYWLYSTILMWLPNVLCIGLGILFFRRASRR